MPISRDLRSHESGQTHIKNFVADQKNIYTTNLFGVGEDKRPAKAVITKFFRDLTSHLVEDKALTQAFEYLHRTPTGSGTDMLDDKVGQLVQTIASDMVGVHEPNFDKMLFRVREEAHKIALKHLVKNELANTYFTLEMREGLAAGDPQQNLLMAIHQRLVDDLDEYLSKHDGEILDERGDRYTFQDALHALLPMQDHIQELVLRLKALVDKGKIDIETLDQSSGTIYDLISNRTLTPSEESDVNAMDADWQARNT